MLDEVLQLLIAARSRAYNTSSYDVIDSAYTQARIIDGTRNSIVVLLGQIETLSNNASVGHYNQLRQARETCAAAKAAYRRIQERYTFPDIDDLDIDEADE